MDPADFLARVRAIVGDAHVWVDSDRIAPFLMDHRGNYHGKARAVVAPASTDEVAALVSLCHTHLVPIVPQGGNTGMVGGSVPDETGDAIVLLTTRLNRIRDIDTANNTMTVEAGCILQHVQEAAHTHERLFPLSLAAEGSATIGGNLSTNAGGTAVLRYGNARELVLGLEAVTPDGRVWHGLTGLRKDNTGYDLKHLLMGAEGTLGIITAAVLKLYPLPQTNLTALIAAPSVAAAIELFSRIRAELGDRLTGCELMSRVCVAGVRKWFSDVPEPFAAQHPWQLLVQLSDTQANVDLATPLSTVLEPAFANETALDAVIATSETQARAMWQMRERIPESERREGKSVKHDISLPISRITPFIAVADAALARAFPEAHVICFGHVGDGNLHYNLSFPARAPTDEESKTANKIVYALLDEWGGSISAEHGIGQLKREEITHHKSPVALDMMRAIKRALDPHGIMNPGKVL